MLASDNLTSEQVVNILLMWANTGVTPDLQLMENLNMIAVDKVCTCMYACMCVCIYRVTPELQLMENLNMIAVDKVCTCMYVYMYVCMASYAQLIECLNIAVCICTCTCTCMTLQYVYAHVNVWHCSMYMHMVVAVCTYI
jgi:hypothetical protein